MDGTDLEKGSNACWGAFRKKEVKYGLCKYCTNYIRKCTVLSHLATIHATGCGERLREFRMKYTKCIGIQLNLNSSAELTFSCFHWIFSARHTVV